MSVELCQPVAGLQPGDHYDGPLADWLVAEGYAKSNADHEPAEQGAHNDPRLAANQPFGVSVEAEVAEEAPAETAEPAAVTAEVVAEGEVTAEVVAEGEVTADVVAEGTIEPAA